MGNQLYTMLDVINNVKTWKSSKNIFTHTVYVLTYKCLRHPTMCKFFFRPSLINMKYHTIQSEKLIKCHHIRAWTQYVSLGKLDLKILISTYYTKDFAWEKRPKFIRFFFLKFQNWALKVPWSITFRKQFQKNYYKYYESLVSGFLVVMGCF